MYNDGQGLENSISSEIPASRCPPCAVRPFCVENSRPEPAVDFSHWSAAVGIGVAPASVELAVSSGAKDVTTRASIVNRTPKLKAQ